MTKRLYYNDITKLKIKIIKDDRFNEYKIVKLTKKLDQLEELINYYINGA